MGQQLSEYEEKRSGVERRQFSYDYHIPERRSGNERRSEPDGRLKPRILE
jgi:hypothetical protein